MSFFFQACTSSEPKIPVNFIGGYYKVVSIHSSKFVDLNNDGQATNALLYEYLKSKQTVNGNTFETFFDFGLFTNLTEVKHRSYHNYANQISFRFPHQVLDSLWTGKAYSNTYLLDFEKSFDTFIFKYGSGKELLLKDANPKFNEKFGQLISLQIINPKTLELNLIKTVYDFSKKEWLKIDMKVTYLKEDMPF